MLAVNAGEVKALYCLSSRENCPSQGDWGQFACGATHALVEEIDVNGMLDAGTEAYRAYIKNRTDCLTQGTELVSVFSSGDPSDIIRTLNQCFLGIDIGPEEAIQLYDATTAYVDAHYDDPYDQGRATVFVLSIVSPFGKVKQLSKAFKLKLLDKLKKLGSPADELAKLRKAIEAEDIEDIRVAIGAAARGSIDNLSAKSKKILESWPDDVYNKFNDEVASTELWDNTFKNAANQDGLINAWKKLDNLGADEALRKNAGALKTLNKLKGDRPAPSTYLDPGYISNHLAKFDKGGSRLVAKSDYDLYGVGKPDAEKTEFVFPTSEMDEILSLPVAEQAKKLGVPIDQLQNSSLVRVDFKPTRLCLINQTKVG